jgi:hypothetical protein
MNNNLQKTEHNGVQKSHNNKLLGSWLKSEEEYHVALTYSEKRIGQFEREDMARLVEVMAKWRLLLGVTADSSPEELTVICQFVYDNFKRLTISDILLAMNWVISGKVEVGFVTQKNISSYYISRALNAYEEEKRRIYNKLMYERDKHLEEQLKLNQPEPTPQEKANSFKELVVSMYRSHKNGGLFVDFGDFVYKWMKRANLLNLPQTVINDAIAYGKSKYLEEKRSENQKNIISQVEPTNKEERQKKLSRQYIIMKFFDEHTIPEIVEKIKPTDFQ